jgi:hypothetical protein
MRESSIVFDAITIIKKGAHHSRPFCYASLGDKLPALNNEFG